MSQLAMSSGANDTATAACAKMAEETAVEGVLIKVDTEVVRQAALFAAALSFKKLQVTASDARRSEFFAALPQAVGSLLRDPWFAKDRPSKRKLEETGSCVEGSDNKVSRTVSSSHVDISDHPESVPENAASAPSNNRHGARAVPKQLEDLMPNPVILNRYRVHTELTCWEQILFCLGVLGHTQNEEEATTEPSTTHQRNFCVRGLQCLSNAFSTTDPLLQHVKSSIPPSAPSLSWNAKSQKRPLGAVPRRAHIGTLACAQCRNQEVMSPRCQDCLDVVMCHNTQYKTRRQGGGCSKEQGIFVELLLMGTKPSKAASRRVHQKRLKVGYLLAEVSANRTGVQPCRRCALLGLRISENARKRGLAKRLLALWLLVCEKLQLQPWTRRMEKPIICLVLQQLGRC